VIVPLGNPCGLSYLQSICSSHAVCTHNTTTQHNTTQHNNATQHNTTQHNTTQCPSNNIPLCFTQATIRQIECLCALTKFRKVTISFVMSVGLSDVLSVCLSVRLSVPLEQLVSHSTNFHYILFPKICRGSSPLINP
jgi:hypothetical protein